MVKSILSYIRAALLGAATAGMLLLSSSSLATDTSVLADYPLNKCPPGEVFTLGTGECVNPDELHYNSCVVFGASLGAVSMATGAISTVLMFTGIGIGAAAALWAVSLITGVVSVGFGLGCGPRPPGAVAPSE